MQNAGTVRWETARCPVSTGARDDEAKLESLLAEGWEPFAATQSSAGHYVYHFRRRLQIDGGGA